MQREWTKYWIIRIKHPGDHAWEICSTYESYEAACDEVVRLNSKYRLVATDIYSRY